MARQWKSLFWILPALAGLVLAGLPGPAGAAQPTGGAAGAEQTQPYVTTGTVNVRGGPGAQHKIVAKIEADTRINVSVNENGWLKVISKKGNPPGYIDEKFAKPLATPAPRVAASSPTLYTTTADTVVREGPGLHFKTVAPIAKGRSVEVVGSQGEWLKVQSRHGRPPGYIEKRFTRPGAE